MNTEERYMWLSLLLPVAILLGVSACELPSTEPLDPSHVSEALPVGEAARRESILSRLCRGKPLVRKACEEKYAKDAGW